MTGEAIATLVAAYAIPGQDLLLYDSNGNLTAHQLRSAGSLGGRVLCSPQLPRGAGPSNFDLPQLHAGGRSRIPVELDDHPRLARGALFRRHLWPRVRVFARSQRLPARPDRQAGHDAKGRAARAWHRLIRLPRAAGPNLGLCSSIRNQRKIDCHLPKRTGPTGFGSYTDYTVHWVYSFESISPLAGLPTPWPISRHKDPTQWRLSFRAATPRPCSRSTPGPSGAPGSRTEHVTVTINGKAVVTLTGSATIATFLATVAAALQASTIAEIAEITWTAGSTTLVGTADTAGLPFTATISTDSASAPSTAAARALARPRSPMPGRPTPRPWPTIRPALPTTGDTLVFTGNGNPCLYSLNALSGVTLAVLTVDQSYTGTIGLPRTHTGGLSSYIEYRPQYFKVGATLLTIGQGPGNGSGASRSTIARSKPPPRSSTPGNRRKPASKACSGKARIARTC